MFIQGGKHFRKGFCYCSCSSDSSGRAWDQLGYEHMTRENIQCKQSSNQWDTEPATQLSFHLFTDEQLLLQRARLAICSSNLFKKHLFYKPVACVPEPGNSADQEQMEVVSWQRQIVSENQVMPGYRAGKLSNLTGVHCINILSNTQAILQETWLPLRWEAFPSLPAQLLVSTVQVIALACFSLSQLSSHWSLIYLLTILSHRKTVGFALFQDNRRKIFLQMQTAMWDGLRDRCLVSIADGLKNPPSPLQNSHPFPFPGQKMCFFALTCWGFAFILREKLQHLEIH